MDILIIDDDIVDREHIRRVLKRSYHTTNITESATVDEGLTLFRANHFDVVLLDYQMPQRDGIEMLVELRSVPLDQSTAIVMLSNSDDEQLALECVKGGAQDFMVKSDVTVSRLWRAIQHAQARFELEQELFNSYRDRNKNQCEFRNSV